MFLATNYSPDPYWVPSTGLSFKLMLDFKCDVGWQKGTPASQEIETRICLHITPFPIWHEEVEADNVFRFIPLVSITPDAPRHRASRAPLASEEGTT